MFFGRRSLLSADADDESGNEEYSDQAAADGVENVLDDSTVEETTADSIDDQQYDNEDITTEEAPVDSFAKKQWERFLAALHSLPSLLRHEIIVEFKYRNSRYYTVVKCI